MSGDDTQHASDGPEPYEIVTAKVCCYASYGELEFCVELIEAGVASIKFERPVFSSIEGWRDFSKAVEKALKIVLNEQG